MFLFFNWYKKHCNLITEYHNVKIQMEQSDLQRHMLSGFHDIKVVGSGGELISMRGFKIVTNFKT